MFSTDPQRPITRARLAARGEAILALLLLTLNACGSDRSPGQVTDTAAEDAPPPPPDAVQFDTSVSPPPDDTTGPTDTATPPPPGTFGAACERGEECDSGYCVATATGFTCTQACIETCPSGYACTGVPSGTGDLSFLCLQRPALLCQPCTGDAECNIGVAGRNRCLAFGAEGSFCGVTCRGESECPDGFDCDLSAPVDGEGQCRPTSGQCECNVLGTRLGRSTVCTETNAFGTCSGSRACGDEGLGACVVEGATVELCNGLDDDCDGNVDEGIAAGVCTPEQAGNACGGVAVCQGGRTVCIGREPTTEVCNGIDDDCNGTTDDGFPDLDQDGIADCADDDIDGDTWANDVDCAPRDAAVHPGAVEVCNEIDDNCNFLVNEAGAEGCEVYLRDADSDGFGAEGLGSQCLCEPNPDTGFVARRARGLDCDDLDPQVNPGAAEVCDGVDNDCNDATDEGVSSPCGGCSEVCLFNVGSRGDEPLDPGAADDGGLIPAEGGGITLSSDSVSIPFIWIANSSVNNVSRLDTTTGREVGRYAVCSDPSRTAVDLFGDGIIACRGDGRIVKIAIVENDCIDRNQNGTIETSRDANDDGVIQPGEMVSGDECVIWNVRPEGNFNGCGASAGCARAAGVDRDNNVWIGMFNSTRLLKIDGSTGETLMTVALTARPYGLAIDADGIIWVASRHPHALVKVHPEDGQLASYGMPGSRNVYGLAIDHAGRPWVATGESNGASRFNPANDSWSHFGPWSARGYTRGVAVRLVRNASGDITGSEVFLAHHQFSGSCGSDTLDRRVTMLNADTGAEIRVLDAGSRRGPVGVAVDTDGKVWTVNQCSSNASRIDPDTGALIGTYPVGTEPYTYSDMTGYALRTITSRTGHYREIFEGWQSGVTRWSSIFVDADMPGNGATWVRLRYRAADTLQALQTGLWSSALGPFPPATLPAAIDVSGRYLQVEVTLGTSEGGLAPVLRGVSAIADQL